VLACFFSPSPSISLADVCIRNSQSFFVENKILNDLTSDDLHNLYLVQKNISRKNEQKWEKISAEIELYN
jgi:hypothetical protein